MGPHTELLSSERVSYFMQNTQDKYKEHVVEMLI
jgi:hypothetical protein